MSSETKCAVRRTINPQRKIEEKERSVANRNSEGGISMQRFADRLYSPACSQVLQTISVREGVPSRLASERSRKFCLAGSFAQLLRSKVAKGISMQPLAWSLSQACWTTTGNLSSETKCSSQNCAQFLHVKEICDSLSRAGRSLPPRRPAMRPSAGRCPLT